jgi:hypothetical protein
MRPTLRQRFFASGAILWLAAFAGAIGVAFLLIPATQLTVFGVLSTAFLICVGGVLGFFLALCPGVIVLGPLMLAIRRINGAPFDVGDQVMILSGKHAGRVVRVYQLWEERAQVRVELGDAERKAVTDVYSETQVCRCRPVE